MSAADASSPHLLSVTKTGRYLIVLSPHARVHLLRRTSSILRLVFLLLVAWVLLWAPLTLDNPG